MRILTVSAVMGAGGAEVVADVLVRDLDRRGHDVLLASGGGFRADRLERDGHRHLRVPLGTGRPLDLLRSVATLRRAVRRERPDVVHAHNVKACVVARLAVGPRVPVVATLHGVPAHQERRAARLLRLCAGHVVAVSSHVAATLRAEGVPADRITVVENAVRPVQPVEREDARRRLGIGDDRPVALVLARLADQKRHDLLLEAWTDVPDTAELLVAGDGPRRAVLEQMVAAMPADVRNRIHLLGTRTDVDVLLGASDLLVLPTDWEGLPISLLEALGAGVPAVVSDVGGVSALAAGVELVRPGSAAALAEAVGTLLQDPDRRLDLARRGRDLVQHRFDPDTMPASYAALLGRVAGVAPAPLRGGSR